MTETLAMATMDFMEAKAMEMHAAEQPAAELVQAGFDYSQIDEGVRDEVREAARKIRAYGESLKGSMIAIGKRLQAVKSMLDHGQFTAWIEAEFSISPRTAQNLMNAARVYGEGKNEIVSLLPDAVLYALAAPSTSVEVREAIEQRAIAGQHITVVDVREAKAAHKPPREVKRLRPEPARPEPAPARAVYVEPTPKPTEAVPVALPIDTPADLRTRGLVIEEYYPDGQTLYRWHGIAEPTKGQVGAGQSSIEDAIRHARRCFEIIESYPADLVRKALDEVAPAIPVYVEQEEQPVAHVADAPADDGRLALAREGVRLAEQTRAWMRAHYHELTGRDTDLLPFERSIVTPLEQLTNLIAILEGAEA